jgi:hypothetical protein
MESTRASRQAQQQCGRKAVSERGVGHRERFVKRQSAQTVDQRARQGRDAVLHLGRVQAPSVHMYTLAPGVRDLPVVRDRDLWKIGCRLELPTVQQRGRTHETAPESRCAACRASSAVGIAERPRASTTTSPTSRARSTACRELTAIRSPRVATPPRRSSDSTTDMCRGSVRASKGASAPPQVSGRQQLPAGVRGRRGWASPAGRRNQPERGCGLPMRRRTGCGVRRSPARPRPGGEARRS